MEFEKPSGWANYKEKTDDIANEMNKILEDEEKGIEEVMARTTNIQNEVKCYAFGKTTAKKGPKQHIQSKRGINNTDIRDEMRKTMHIIEEKSKRSIN